MNPITWFFEYLAIKLPAYPKLFVSLIIVFSIFMAVGVDLLRVTGSVGNIFNPKSQYVKDFQNLVDNYKNLEREIILVVENDNILSKTSIEEISNLHLELEFLENVTEVVSIASLRTAPNKAGDIGQIIAQENIDKLGEKAIHKLLYEHPFARHRLISADQKKSLIIISLKPIENRSESLATLRKNARILAAQNLKHSQYSFTGFLAVSAEIIHEIYNNQIFFLIGGAIFGLLLGYLFFRHATLVLATAIPAITAIFWVLGIMGWMKVDVNVMTNVVPTIMMVIAFADAMHMVDAMRGRLKLGENARQAVGYAIRKIGPACFFTTATTSIAFLSLSFASTPIVADFGKAAAMGTFAALFSALILSSIICIIMNKILPVKPDLHSHHKNGYVHHQFSRLSLFIGKIATGHAKKIISISVIILIGLAYIHLQNQPEYRYSENLPRHSVSGYAIGVVDENLGGINTFHYVVKRKDGKKLALDDENLAQIMHKLELQIAENNVYQSYTGIMDIKQWMLEDGDIMSIKTFYDAYPKAISNRFIAKNLESILVMAFTKDIGAKALRPFLEAERQKANLILKSYPNYKVILTGLAAMSAVESDAMIGELNFGLLVAMVIIILLMGFVFKSAFYALASILPNLLPIVAGGALLYYISDGLQFSTIIALTIAFGIAVDDSIHFLYQFKENKKKYNVKQAIEATLKQVGPVLIASTFMLSSGLGLMFSSDLQQMSLFGTVVIFILNVALIADIAILPSIFYIYYKRYE